MKKNFRTLKQVTMVEVCEGEGTSMDLARIVRYFYDGDQFIGEIDPAEPEHTSS
jgi:hypothetical protein